VAIWVNLGIQVVLIAVGWCRRGRFIGVIFTAVWIIDRLSCAPSAAQAEARPPARTAAAAA